MPKTARRTWQQAESRAAALFGVRRQIGSGSAGREDLTASDSTHPVLFIESKLRHCHTTRTLHDATKRLAARERKLPVLALFDKNRPGFLIVVHSDDLATVAAEFTKANALPADCDPPPGWPLAAGRALGDQTEEGVDPAGDGSTGILEAL
jgi:hypothetical protein